MIAERPGDNDGVPGTVYVLHLDPPYRHAGHYVGWTQGDVDARIATHLQSRGSPLIRAAAASGVRVRLATTIAGSRGIERRLKRWHKAARFCPICRARPKTPAPTGVQSGPPQSTDGDRG